MNELKNPITAEIEDGIFYKPENLLRMKIRDSNGITRHVLMETKEWNREFLEFIVRAVNEYESNVKTIYDQAELINQLRIEREALLHASRRAFYLIKEGGFTHPMTADY